MLRVAIVGASGYTGGELLRLLLFHPCVDAIQATSERLAGKPVVKAHPNLRGVTRLRFASAADLAPCDLAFLCLPHGETMARWREFAGLAPKIIDLSADFRLRDEDVYQRFYGREHARSELLGRFVYGLPELNREAIARADWVACPGCNATATLLALYPLYCAGLVEPDRTTIEVKVGSSEGGARATDASHHPERSGCLRSFSPVGHRHTAEIEQELSFQRPERVHFSATSVEMVRGALATGHVFLSEDVDERGLWRLYREVYGESPFVRIVAERDGYYRYPEPKLLAGTNYCDVGFARDPHANRAVAIAAIDNLMKGAAGQAVQNMNLMCGFPESTALEFPGLHPV